MLDEYLEGYRDPQAYDAIEGDDDEDLPLIEQWARSLGGPLLDLACGTGTMAILSRQGSAIRSRGWILCQRSSHGPPQKAATQSVSAEWVVADARTFHLQKQFPFIYMLGNAFQHFLTRADQEALLARVRDHVPPEGRFLFCTRNPSPHHLQQARSAEPQQYTLPDGRQQVSTEQQAYDPLSQIQYYTWHEQWLYPDERREEKTTRTALRYVYPQEMEALLFYNGFEIDACYGDWQQGPLTATSRQMIYVCQRRG